MRISDWSSDVCSSDLERAYVGRPGVELAGERARIVTVARQRGFEVVNRLRQHLLDDLGRDGLGSEAEALLEGECQVHLDLERGAQALGDEVDRVLVHQVGNLDPLGRTGAEQPGHIVAAFGADALIVEGDRKSTRLNSITNAHLVCRLLLEKKK